MASEVEIERLVVRLLGDNSGYQKMTEEAQDITRRLESEMRRLGGTQAELSAVTARTAGFVQQAAQATGLYYFEERRLQGLLNAGRISQESYNRQLDTTRGRLESVATAVNNEINSLSRGVELTRRSENAQERHNRELREYTELLNRTHISQEAFNRLKSASLTSYFNAPPPSTAMAFGAQMQQASLERSRALTMSVRTAQEQYNDAMAEYNELASRSTEHGGISRETFNRLQQQQQQILQAAAPSTFSTFGAQMQQASLERGRELTMSVRTAQERYNETMAEFTELSRHGSITQETFNRLQQQQQQILLTAPTPLRILGQQMKTAGAEARNFGLIWAMGVTAPVIAFMKKAGGAAVTMDSLRRGLNALSKSPKEVEDQLVRLREVAKLPGLGFKESIEGSVRLQAAGMSARMAERSLLAFGNALATVGKGKADLDGVNLALSQMMSKSIISGQELNQLGERLPQIRQVMLRAFGTISGEEIGKLGLTSTQVIERIVEELEKLPKVTGGAQNALENLSDSVFISMSKIGNSVLRVALPLLEMLGKRLEDAAEWFDKLSPTVQNTAVIMAMFLAGIGPVIVVVGQLVSAIGTLIVAYNALAASQSALAAATLLGWQLVLTGAIVGAIALLIASMTGYLEATNELNASIEKSMSLHNDQLAIWARQRAEIIEVVNALEGLARTEFLESQISEARDKVNEYAEALRAAKTELKRLVDVASDEAMSRTFHFGPLIPANVKEQQAKIAELEKTLKDATAWTNKLNEELTNTEAPPSTLETLKSIAALKKETDDYIKSLKRKIELEERGEAGSKIQSLKDRGVDPDKIREIEELVAKEKKLSDAKKLRVDTENLLERAATKAVTAAETAAKKRERESQDLEHDIQQLDERLKHQIDTFDAVGESAQVFALGQRVAAGNATDHAKALLEQAKSHDIVLQKMKERKKLEEEALEIRKKYDPSEAFKEEFKRLTEMSKAGLIAEGTFDLAVKEIEDKLKDTQEKADIKVRFTVEGNEAVRRGSAEFQKMLAEVEKANMAIVKSKQIAAMKDQINEGLGIPAIPGVVQLDRFGKDAEKMLRENIPEALALPAIPPALVGGEGVQGMTTTGMLLVEQQAMMNADQGHSVAGTQEDFSKEMIALLGGILEVNEQQLEEPMIEFTELGIGG